MNEGREGGREGGRGPKEVEWCTKDVNETKQF